MENITGMVQNTLFGEKYARREGFLQGLDARTKIIFLLSFILTVSLIKRIEPLLILYLFLILLSSLSAIGLSFFILRVWLFIPLFSSFIVFPAIFNFITPGDPLLVITHFDKDISLFFFSLPGQIAITRQGMATASLFVGRVAVSVSVVILVQLTTKWHELLDSLSLFKVPSLFILTLEMSYRYMILLARTISDMHLAKKSRTIRSSPTTSEQRWVAGGMASLFRKSMRLSEDVYGAMMSRGFSGEVKSFKKSSLGMRDYGFIAASLLLCILALFAGGGW